ncbi:hypothetical protein V1478_004944 [Vespula squamosa]|uniref:Uncharacterized protein n=1 Tax=Vespula squamosa TaxID=30214 RepID=A0ABD2BFF9_VESSQ
MNETRCINKLNTVLSFATKILISKSRHKTRLLSKTFDCNNCDHNCMIYSRLAPSKHQQLPYSFSVFCKRIQFISFTVPYMHKGMFKHQNRIRKNVFLSKLVDPIDFAIVLFFQKNNKLKFINSEMKCGHALGQYADLEEIGDSWVCLDKA